MKDKNDCKDYTNSKGNINSYKYIAVRNLFIKKLFRNHGNEIPVVI